MSFSSTSFESLGSTSSSFTTAGSPFFIVFSPFSAEVITGVKSVFVSFI
jgi:hypothetical protein